MSRVKPERHLRSVNMQVAVPAPGCQIWVLGVFGGDPALVMLLPCPGTVNKGSLPLQTSSSSSHAPVPLPSDRVFLPGLCFKPAIRRDSLLLTAVSYRCCVFPPSLSFLSAPTPCSHGSSAFRLTLPIFCTLLSFLACRSSPLYVSRHHLCLCSN